MNKKKNNLLIFYLMLVFFWSVIGSSFFLLPVYIFGFVLLPIIILFELSIILLGILSIGMICFCLISKFEKKTLVIPGLIFIIFLMDETGSWRFLGRCWRFLCESIYFWAHPSIDNIFKTSAILFLLFYSAYLIRKYKSVL